MKSRLTDPRLIALHRELGIPEDYEFTRKLPFHAEAAELVIGDTDPNGIKIPLTIEAAKRWKAMKDSAASDGIVLYLESGFRSYDVQAQLIRDEASRGIPLAKTLTWIAAPGFSEHHTGRALDIASPDCFPSTPEFEKTVASDWLKKRAGEFGFTLSYPPGNPFGIIYEPWHWLAAP